MGYSVGCNRGYPVASSSFSFKNRLPSRPKAAVRSLELTPSPQEDYPGQFPIPLNRPSKPPPSTPRRFPSAAEASPRKSPLPSYSSPLMKVLISPVWISPSMEAWRRSDPGAVPWLAHKPRQSWDLASQTLVLTQGRRNIMSYAIVGFGNIGRALAKASDRRDRRQADRGDRY